MLAQAIQMQQKRKEIKIRNLGSINFNTYTHILLKFSLS